MFTIKFNNYRGFKNEEFKFSRINILIGENSAGKSSIFKFLLALKQSLRSPNNKESNLSFSSEDTDLGSYRDVIANHDIKKKLLFSFTFNNDYFEYFLNYMLGPADEELPDSFEKRDSFIGSFFQGISQEKTTAEFTLSSDLSEHKNISTIIYNEKIGELNFSFKEYLNNEVGQDIYLLDNKPICTVIFKSYFYKKTFIFDEIEYEKQAFLTIIDGGSLREQIEKQFKDEEFSRLYWHIAFLLVAQNFTQLKLSILDYINPILSEPAKRIYIKGDQRNTNRIRNIKDLVDFLSNKKTHPSFKKDLSKILSTFGIADSIDLKQQNDGFTNELRLTQNGLENNIKDVGFGVSLQIPIFAQALISENNVPTRNLLTKRHSNFYGKGEILLIEQPEVHLHPSLQAKFIDTLLQIGNNNVYFIETHSEHIIRMLQLLVKERKYNLNSEDIAIYYLKKDGKRMISTFHKIDSKTGKLTPNFPKGFYDVSYNLTFKLME